MDENKLLRETIDLTIKADIEDKRVNNLDTLSKYKYIYNALKSYLYYEWWAYYFNESDRKAYKYAKEVINIKSKIDKGELCSCLNDPKYNTN